MKTPHKLETQAYSQILPDVCEKNYFRFVHSSTSRKPHFCNPVPQQLLQSLYYSLTKKELKTTLQTWEEDQTTFHQFLQLLTQKTQQYPEQGSVDQAFHSPHLGPGQDPQFLHNKNNEKNLITAKLNDATYRSFKSTDYSSSHYVTFFSSLICVMVIYIIIKQNSFIHQMFHEYLDNTSISFTVSFTAK